jgi:hypothetical protein
MIEPFFFSDGQLFGCYHPASGFSAQRLLVACPPFFDEYRISYRALAELANACAGQGVHVLRFNFYGTGESMGDLDQASVERWKADILAAIEEGVALSGADDVALLGVRFGATMAAQVAHSAIRRYIFWDPVDGGPAYLDWLDEANLRLEESHRQLAKHINRPLESIVFENFALSSTLREGIRTLDFNPDETVEHARYIVITTDRRVYETKKYSQSEYPGLSSDWNAYQDGIVSQKPVLESIARRILER